MKNFRVSLFQNMHQTVVKEWKKLLKEWKMMSSFESDSYS